VSRSVADHRGFSWTGCYAGGHAGGLWGDSDKWIPRTPGGAYGGVSLGGHEADGFIGGVQAGCNYQMASGVVVGMAGDYGWTGADTPPIRARNARVLSQRA
jgi:outer membrane immunogenic protein